MFPHIHAQLVLPVDRLAELLAGQLQVGEDEGAAAVEKPKVLDELSIDGIVTHLKKIMASEDSKLACKERGACNTTCHKYICETVSL